MEREVVVGGQHARLFVPDGAGPWPLVVFYMDAGGLRDAMTTMARRMCGLGVAVVQPNLYWRHGPYRPFDAKTVFGDPAERQRLMGMVSSVKAPEVMVDTVALLDVLTADRSLRTDRIGAVGYCMGGRMAFVLGCHLGRRVAAVAAIHAGGLVSDVAESPHRAVAGLTAWTYVGVADQDQSCTEAHQQALRHALDAVGARYRLELYAGARHGFAVPDFPVFDASAAERHWDRLRELVAELRAN